MQHADGEILAARAAARFGVPFTLSTMSICSIEDVAASPDPFWFQLYVMRDEDFVDAIIERARAAVFGAGPDAGPADPGPAPQGPEERPDQPAQADLPNILNMMTKPRWSLGMLRRPRAAQFRNIVGHVKVGTDLADLTAWRTNSSTPSWTGPRSPASATSGRASSS
jgi:L-lactate dehydrogenase (cytochrome)